MEGFEWKDDKVFKGIEPFIYIIANKFRQTALSLDKSFTEPIIVNLAFSIELYLKSLDTTLTYSKKEDETLFTLKRDLKTIHGHKFDEIFIKLNKPIQSDLSNQYFNEYNVDFKQDLIKIKNAFVEFRYSFEHEHLTINNTILERIANFLKAFIEQKLKNQSYS